MIGNVDDQNVTSDGRLWYKTLPKPDGRPLILGKAYLLDGQWFRYIGDFNNVSEVPNTTCIFTIADMVFKRIKLEVNVVQKPKIKRKRDSDSSPIMTTITDVDNPLMCLMKQVLEDRGITRGDFKTLYDNDSDMNNSLRGIESGGNLSWPKFDDLRDRIEMDYQLTLKGKDGYTRTISSNPEAFETSKKQKGKPKEK